jgi:heat shock protein HslJ
MMIVKVIAALLLFVLLVQCKTAEQNAGTTSLENTYWKLTEMDGQPVTTPEGARPVHMILATENGEKRVKGFAGCNGLGGDFTTEGSKVHFTIITTKMFCEETMAVENFLTDALNKADNYKINGDTLELYQGSTFLIRFQAEPAK